MRRVLFLLPVLGLLAGPARAEVSLVQVESSLEKALPDPGADDLGAVEARLESGTPGQLYVDSREVHRALEDLCAEDEAAGTSGPGCVAARRAYNTAKSSFRIVQRQLSDGLDPFLEAMFWGGQTSWHVQPEVLPDR